MAVVAASEVAELSTELEYVGACGSALLVPTKPANVVPLPKPVEIFSFRCQDFCDMQLTIHHGQARGG